jgi:hypothetical protein
MACNTFIINLCTYKVGLSDKVIYPEGSDLTRCLLLRGQCSRGIKILQWRLVTKATDHPQFLLPPPRETFI